MLVPSLPSRNKVLVIAVKNYTETGFLVLSSYAWFLYLVPNILSRIVGVYCSMEELVTMASSFKTGIISVVYTGKEILF